MTSFNAVSISDGSFDYSVDYQTREVTITGYLGDSSDLVIPATYNNKPIVAIDEEVFSGDFDLTTVKFEEGSELATIGNKAFYNCDSLETIELPATVTEIGESAFEECVALTSVVYSGTSFSLGNGAFSGCIKLVDFDTTKVTAFGSNCLQGTAITSAVIATDITSINEGVFKDCVALTSVVIPSTVTEIGNGAFANCSSATFEYPATSSVALGNDAFLNCKKFDGLSNAKLTAVGDNCLKGTAVTSIYVKPEVASIGVEAFKDCSNLVSLFVGGKYTTVGEGCLDNANADLVVFSDYASYTNILADSKGITNYIIGDANQDKNLNIKDATYIQLSLARYITLDEVAEKCADANIDSIKNIRDATHIQGYLAKYYDEL